LKWETLRAHIQLFIEKSAEVPFSIDHVDLTSPEGQQEAVRYLLVCGHIPVTTDNVMFLKDMEFHIDADHLPENLRKQVLELAMKQRQAYRGVDAEPWSYVEETELEELKVLSQVLDCVRIKNGEVVEAGIIEERKIKVATRWDTEIRKKIEL